MGTLKQTGGTPAVYLAAVLRFSFEADQHGVPKGEFVAFIMPPGSQEHGEASLVNIKTSCKNFHLLLRPLEKQQRPAVIDSR